MVNVVDILRVCDRTEMAIYLPMNWTGNVQNFATDIRQKQEVVILNFVTYF